MKCYSRPIKAVLRRLVELKLRTLVAMVNDATWTALCNRHIERSENPF
jgi:hypothetical protein